MALTIFYSDSEEFLMGLASGIEYIADSACEVLINAPTKSDNERFTWMLAIEDQDVNQLTEQYYNGASFDLNVAAFPHLKSVI